MHVKVCGSTDYCGNIKFDLSTLKSLVSVQACQYKNEDGSDTNCYPDINNFADNAIYTLDYEIVWEDPNNKTKIKSVNQKRRSDADGYGAFAELTGRPDISTIYYDVDNGTVAECLTKGKFLIHRLFK